MRLAGLLLLTLALTAPARADAPGPIERVEALMRGMRYEAARTEGDRLVHAVPSPAREELAKLYRLIAICQLSMGDEAGARWSFLQLLAVDANARLPEDASPKVRAFFDQISIVAAGVDLRREQVTRIERGRAALVDITPRRSSLVASIRLHPANAPVIALRSAGERFTVELPPPSTGDRLAYWIEARDAAGVPVALAGTETAPLVFEWGAPTVVAATPVKEARAQTTRPLMKRPWFWVVVATSVAVVATGVSLGVYYGTRSSEPALGACLVPTGTLACP